MGIIQKICRVVLFFFGLLLFVVAYSNFQDTREYLTSEKVKTTAVIRKDDQGVKTYNFSGNSYGTTGRDPLTRNIGRDGQKVTIYYQKSKPYVVYRSAKPRLIALNYLIPLLQGLFFVGLSLGEKILNEWALQRLASSK